MAMSHIAASIDQPVAPVKEKKQRGLLATYWRRFRKHGLATVGLVMLALMLIMTIIGPLVIALPIVDPTSVTVTKDLAPGTHTIKFITGTRDVFYPMGTDALGKDVWASIVNGAHTSLTVGFVATIMACIIGTIVGMVAGYFGGWVDALLMRIADMFLAIPLLLFLLLATRFLVDPANQNIGSTFQLALIIGTLEWPAIARLVRSVTLSIREQDYILAAQAVGQRSFPIIFRHVMPNALNPVIVAGTLFVASNIVLEAFLSFLGFGVQPPDVSWGTILSNAQDELALGNWWWATFPGIFILLTVLSINFIGDGLRDALDPRTLL